MNRKLALLAVAALADILPDDECEGECALNALQRKAVGTTSCKDAEPGDACYKEIMWAKHTGIRQHPHWYPGLTSQSSNAKFQEIVHKHKSVCAMPCASSGACHTALPGESCYKDIMWAKGDGLRQHPQWYHGLSASSSLEDFQANIHSKRPDKCPMPCAKAPAPEEVPELPNVMSSPMPDAEPETVAPTTQATTTMAPTTQQTTQATQAPTQAPTEAPQQQDESNSYQNSPCNQLQTQHEREACFQEEIRKEQLAREAAERQEREQEQHRQESMTLDERQREIIDEIGGVPTAGSLPDFSDEDPDA